MGYLDALIIWLDIDPIRAGAVISIALAIFFERISN